MRTLPFAAICMIIFSTPAMACRGTVEYPEAFQLLEEMEVSPERKTEIMEQLSEGQATHEEGHRLDDEEKMEKSLRILDAITEELGQ